MFYKAEVENELDRKIKVVRSNCCGEYYGKCDELGEQSSRPFASYLEECGIVIQYTMIGTPLINGVADMRSMMAYSNILESLWEETVKAIIYNLNQVPSKAVTKIPYELWTRKGPRLGIFMFWVVQLKLGPIDLMTGNWGQEQLAATLLDT